MKNKTLNQSIGIIGGMGPQASAKLLGVLIDMCVEEFGARDDGDFPEIVLDSVPTPNFISNEKNVKTALNILNKRVKNLESFDPSFFAIACNTAHLLLRDLRKNTNVPFVSMIDEVVKQVSSSKIKKVGLLGTPITIKFRLYESVLDENNIRVILPTNKELLIVEDVIRKVLSGKITDKDKLSLLKIAGALKVRGAEGIILGCTELPLIFPKDISIPIFDSIEILARALLKSFYETESKNAIIKI